MDENGEILSLEPELEISAEEINFDNFNDIDDIDDAPEFPFPPSIDWETPSANEYTQVVNNGWTETNQGWTHLDWEWDYNTETWTRKPLPMFIPEGEHPRHPTEYYNDFERNSPFFNNGWSRSFMQWRHPDWVWHRDLGSWIPSGAHEDLRNVRPEEIPFEDPRIEINSEPLIAEPEFPYSPHLLPLYKDDKKGICDACDNVDIYEPAQLDLLLGDIESHFPEGVEIYSSLGGEWRKSHIKRICKLYKNLNCP